MKKSALSVAFASKTDSNWLTDVTSATETAAGEQRRSQKSLQSFFIQPDAWNVPCRTLTRHFCTRGGSEAKKNHRVMNKNSGRNNDSLPQATGELDQAASASNGRVDGIVSIGARKQ